MVTFPILNSQFHAFPTILPRVRSRGESSTLTRSPINNRMNVRFGPLTGCAVTSRCRSITIRYNPLGSCSTNPATGKQQLNMFSEAQEVQLGRENHELVVRQIGLYPDEDMQRYVQDIGRRLAASSERPGLPWNFAVVDDAAVNAFAVLRFGSRTLNWLHASYGVGAALGPILLTSLMTAGWGWRC